MFGDAGFQRSLIQSLRSSSIREVYGQSISQGSAHARRIHAGELALLEARYGLQLPCSLHLFLERKIPLLEQEFGTRQRLACPDPLGLGLLLGLPGGLLALQGVVGLPGLLLREAPVLEGEEADDSDEENI